MIFMYSCELDIDRKEDILIVHVSFPQVYYYLISYHSFWGYAFDTQLIIPKVENYSTV